MTVRRTMAGLAVLVALALTGTACDRLTGGRGDDQPSPTPATPREALTASTKAFSTMSFSCTMKDAESTGECQVDPTAGHARLDLTFADAEIGLEFTFNLLVRGDDTWLKVDFGRATGDPRLPDLPKGWMHLDRSRIKDGDDLAFRNEDPAGAHHVMAAIVDVEAAGDRRYKGTVDLPKATESALVNDDHAKALGDKAAAVPFEATLDDQGRLATLTITVPAAGDDEAQTWEATYLNYGVPIQVDAPTGEVVEAPDEVYEIFS